jgi:ribosomal protein S18 acetylase RimI-like enzyme
MVLASAGYSLFDPSLVMTALISDGASDAAIEIESAPSAEWLEGHAQANDVSVARRPAHAAIVRSIVVPAAFATVRKAGRPAGFGLAVCERGMVGLFDIVVAPEARRQGLGRAVTEALLHWGYRSGARTAYLQVRAVNAPALDLYARLGFAEAYRYHYRIPRG